MVSSARFSAATAACRSLNSARSAPAQKPCPAPVSTIAPTASSASAARSASSSAWVSSVLSALRFSGRFMVRMRTCAAVLRSAAFIATRASCAPASSSCTRRRMTSAAGRMSSTRPALCPASTLPHSTSPSSAAFFSDGCLKIIQLSRDAPARCAASYLREKAFFSCRIGSAAAPDQAGVADVGGEHRLLVVLVHARLGRGDEARAELHRLGAEREQRGDAGAVGDAAARHHRQPASRAPRGAPAPACRPRRRRMPARLRAVDHQRIDARRLGLLRVLDRGDDVQPLRADGAKARQLLARPALRSDHDRDLLLVRRSPAAPARAGCSAGCSRRRASSSPP